MPDSSNKADLLKTSQQGSSTSAASKKPSKSTSAVFDAQKERNCARTILTERYFKAALNYISAQSMYDHAVASAVKVSSGMKCKERKTSALKASLDAAASPPPERWWFAEWFGENTTEVDRRRLEKELELAQEDLADARFHAELISAMESEALRELHDAETEHIEASKADPKLAATVTIEALMSMESKSVSSGGGSSDGGEGLRQRGSTKRASQIQY
jgi:hypothetical protein